MVLQVYYDIEQEKNKENNQKPNLSLLRKVLFWDTDINKVDWQKKKRSSKEFLNAAMKKKKGDQSFLWL